jgi:hypothetical protein
LTPKGVDEHFRRLILSQCPQLNAGYFDSGP